MSNMYLDPNGRVITYKQWKQRVPAEYMIHEHRTPKTITRLFSADIVMDANLIPVELHKRYRMQSTNIMTEDSLGNEYDEPKYVEDEFAAKMFTSKEKAVKGYVEFLVSYCNGKQASLEEELSKEVAVTPVAGITLRPKDMELGGIGSARPAPTAGPALPEEVDDMGSGDEDDDGPTLSRKEKAAKEPKAASKDEPKPAKGSDAPSTAIKDEIGSW